MKKLIIVIGLVILFTGLLSGCTSDTVVTEDTEGTLISVKTKSADLFNEETIIIEFGNNSKAILSGINRYDNDGIDWYEYLKPLIGKNIRITWYVNYKESGIISVENIE